MYQNLHTKNEENYFVEDISCLRNDQLKDLRCKHFCNWDPLNSFVQLNFIFQANMIFPIYFKVWSKNYVTMIVLPNSISTMCSVHTLNCAFQKQTTDEIVLKRSLLEIAQLLLALTFPKVTTDNLPFTSESERKGQKNTFYISLDLTITIDIMITATCNFFAEP